MTQNADDSVGLVPSRGDRSLQDRSGTEHWLIYCPAIASDTLLLFISQGESYSLRSYIGRLGLVLGGSHAEGAHTTSEFRRIYEPEMVASVDHVRENVDLRVAEWERIVDGRWSDYGRERAKRG